MNTFTYRVLVRSHSYKQEWWAKASGCECNCRVLPTEDLRVQGQTSQWGKRAALTPQVGRAPRPALRASVSWCHQQVIRGSLRIWVFFSQKCWEKVSVWQSIWPHHVTGEGSGEPQLGPGLGEHKTWPSESSGVHITSQEEVCENPCVL